MWKIGILGLTGLCYLRIQPSSSITKEISPIEKEPCKNDRQELMEKVNNFYKIIGESIVLTEKTFPSKAALEYPFPKDYFDQRHNSLNQSFHKKENLFYNLSDHLYGILKMVFPTSSIDGSRVNQRHLSELLMGFQKSEITAANLRQEIQKMIGASVETVHVNHPAFEIRLCMSEKDWTSKMIVDVKNFVKPWKSKRWIINDQLLTFSELLKGILECF